MVWLGIGAAIKHDQMSSSGTNKKTAVVAQAYNPNTWEAEVESGRAASSRPAWFDSKRKEKKS